jgi:hypothetical protein
MNSGPASHRNPYDFAQDLIDELEGDTTESGDIMRRRGQACLHLYVTIGECAHWALVDTGSQVTCMSDEFYKRLQGRMTLCELPVANTHVWSAFREKLTPVKKQVMIALMVDGKVVEHVSL